MTWSRSLGPTPILLFVAIAVTGCADNPHWWARLGNTEADFRRDNAVCVGQATTQKPGKPTDVIDAALHRACLEDLGYYPVDPDKGWHDGRK